MGRVRLKPIKRIGMELWQKYRERFKESFEENKKIVDELIEYKSKKLRNKIAGYITHLVKLERKRAKLKQSQSASS